MDAPHWLHELRAELARRKLPPLYVERFVSEMSDHFSDCMEDRMSTDAKDLHGVFQRLGTPGDVARSAAQEFRQAKFSRRHPVLMFVLLPVLSLPMLWCLKTAAVILLIKMLGIKEGLQLGETAETALWLLFLSVTVVPVVVAAAFFCWQAVRAGMNWKWSLAACSLLAIIGGAAVTSLTLPTETSKGSLSFGFGISTHPTATQVLQFLLPLAICGWAVWRQLRDRERPSHLA